MIRSAKLRKHARGKACTLRFACCDGGGETTVLAHIRDGSKGMAQKASDLSACYACGPCHDWLDHQVHKIDPADLYFHQLRALQETIEILCADGIIIVPQDIAAPMMQREIKPRKDRDQRAPIQSRETKWPSRPFTTGKN